MTATAARAVGSPLGRLEGPAKVIGAARYAAEYPVENVAHAWVVRSPVARGTLDAVIVDPTTEDDDMLAVLWPGNARGWPSPTTRNWPCCSPSGSATAVRRSRSSSPAPWRRPRARPGCCGWRSPRNRTTAC